LQIEQLRRDVEVQIEALRGEVRTQVEGLRGETRTQIEALRGELKADIERSRHTLLASFRGQVLLCNILGRRRRRCAARGSPDKSCIGAACHHAPRRL